MIKTFFKKFKGAFEQIIGSAIVVCAEVVINKKWNPNTDFIGNALRVPSKNFYDYLGHTLVPDEGLKDKTEDGIGLGLGPYNNDLGHAVDKDTFSSPAPVSFSSDTIETSEVVFSQKKKFSNSGTESGSEEKWYNFQLTWPYKTPNEADGTAVGVNHEYVWGGTWGDTQNKFQTTATFQVEIDYDVKKTGGGIISYNIPIINEQITSKADTGALAFNILCGSKNDQTTENVILYYDSGEAAQSRYNQQSEGNPASAPTQITLTNNYTFFNPHYSSGNWYFRDDDKGKIIHIFTASRKPFEESLLFNMSYAGEAGEYQPFPVSQWAEKFTSLIFPDAARRIFNIVSTVVNFIIDAWNGIVNVISNLVSLVPGASGVVQTLTQTEKIDPPFGDQIRAIIKDIFSWLFNFINIILRAILGEDAIIPTYFSSSIRELNRQEMTLSHPDFLETRMNKFWGGVFEKSYVYSQFWYPDFNKNPIFSFADTFNFREPFLNNLVVENQYHNDTFRSDNPYTKKYKFFVPSLFSLLYETNLGAFYEQLAKLHNNEALSRLKPKFNLNIKIDNFNVPEDSYKFISQQQKTIYDLMLPSNIDISENLLLEYANNTGYTDTTEATSAATIGAIVAGATPVDTKKNASYPSEYNSVFTDYPFLSAYKGSITDINTVIGDFSDIKAKLEADDGLKLETWTNYCNSSDFSTLSTGVPRNLAYKLIEYILWYVDPEGIVDEIRQDVRSLIAYEKFLDRDIDEYRKSSDGSDFENFHIIGTEIYQRNCPPDSNSFT